MLRGIKIPLRDKRLLKHAKTMKNDTVKRIKRRGAIKVYIVNPEGGLSFERLSTALNLILSEKDVLHYLNEHQKVSSPIVGGPQILAKST